MDNFTTDTRKIRVSFSDPDATDSSSDELEAPQKKSKQIIHEIEFNLKTVRVINDVRQRKSLGKKLGAPKKIKNSTGVRLRKGGKYAAVIGDPIQKKRVWLGTFTSAEEASMAYNSKKSEFQEMLRAKRGFDWAPCEDNLSDLLSSGGGEAVEEGISGENEAVGSPKAEELGFFRGVQIVDDNGFFIGDFTKLDDLRICADENAIILA